MYTVDDGIAPVCKNMELTTTLVAITVEVSEVMSSIDRLKNNCSSGPDGFPPVMYRCLKHCLSAPLAILYNQFLSVGYVPLEWRAAHIVPVHKKVPLAMSIIIALYRLPVLLPKFLNK